MIGQLLFLNMLNKKNRLTKKKEIDLVFKKGKSGYNKYFGIKIVENRLGSSRVAIIIGLRVSRKAVTRNKVKRRITHILKQEFPDLKSTYDIVVVVLPPTINLNFQELKYSIHSNFSKLGVFEF